MVISLIAFLACSKTLQMTTKAQKGGSQEIMTVPIQQMVRTYLYSPDTYTDEEKELLFGMISEKEMHLYNARLSDLVKSQFNNEKFKENKYINSLTPSTTFNAFLQKVIVVGGNVVLKNSNGVEKNGDAFVATGDKLLVYDKNGLRDEYTLSVMGDVTEDGKSNINDIIKLSKYILNNNVFSGDVYINAGDFTNNKKIDINDIIRLAKNIINNGL